MARTADTPDDALARAARAFAGPMYENGIERYAIGDRTPGLRHERDGSVIVYVQHERRADSAKQAHWLPAPAGQFRLVMRRYQPRRAVISGAWKPPWVKRQP